MGESIDSGNPDLAGSGSQKGGNYPQSGGFTGTIVTQKAENLAPLDHEGDFPKGLEVSVAFSELNSLESRG